MWLPLEKMLKYYVNILTKYKKVTFQIVVYLMVLINKKVEGLNDSATIAGPTFH